MALGLQIMSCHFTFKKKYKTAFWPSLTDQNEKQLSSQISSSPIVDNRPVHVQRWRARRGLSTWAAVRTLRTTGTWSWGVERRGEGTGSTGTSHHRHNHTWAEVGTRVNNIRKIQCHFILKGVSEKKTLLQTQTFGTSCSETTNLLGVEIWQLRVLMSHEYSL